MFDDRTEFRELVFMGLCNVIGAGAIDEYLGVVNDSVDVLRQSP